MKEAELAGGRTNDHRKQFTLSQICMKGCMYVCVKGCNAETGLITTRLPACSFAKRHIRNIFVQATGRAAAAKGHLSAPGKQQLSTAAVPARC